MGRTATFDRAELVGAARDLFWRRGFGEVSVTDIEKATGVGRSSIYHAFGSMRGLFDTAVEDYLNTVVRPRLAGLVADEVSPDALIDYLAGLRDAILTIAQTGAAPAGCLILTASATPIGSDETVHAVIESCRAELASAVLRGVQALLPDATPSVVDHHTRLTVAAIIAAQCLARIDAAEAARTLDAAGEALGAAAALEG